MAAGDEAAQGEVLAQVLARRCFDRALQAFLDGLIGLEGDQAVVLGGLQVDAPIGEVDASGIDGTGEQLLDALQMHLAISICGVGTARLQKAFHFALRFETPRCVAIERFLNDRGHGLVTDQYFALAAGPLEAVTGYSAKDPIAVHGAGTHAVLCLLAVLLALVLRDAGQEVLDQDGVRVLAELNGGALQLAARIADGRAQTQVRFKAARETADIIDDDDAVLSTMAPKKAQHRLHAGAVNHAAGHVVPKHLGHGIRFVLGVLPAAGFLRSEAVAFGGLLGAGHAAIDDCFLFAGSLVRPDLFLLLGWHDLTPLRCRSAGQPVQSDL